MPKRLQLRGKQLAELRDKIYARAQGCCDYCGIGVPNDGWHLHHRQLRSGSGPDTPENCIVTHPWCHNQIHAEPLSSMETGFIVSRYRTPHLAPIMIHNRMWMVTASQYGGRVSLWMPTDEPGSFYSFTPVRE